MNNQKVSSEWEDIQRKLGNLPPKELEISEEALQEMVQEAAANYDPLANKTLDELDELEDEEDDRVLQEYRKKRLEEMRAQALKNKYGSVIPIGADDFIAQVNNAEKEVYVVIHLHAPGVVDCDIMDHCMRECAKKFRYVKFIRIKSTDAIKNYPDRNCPTILIYFNGTLFKQWVTLDVFAGKKTKPEDLEWALSRAGIVKSDLDEDPRIAKKDSVVVNVHRNNIRSTNRRRDSDEEDNGDDDDDY